MTRTWGSAGETKTSKTWGQSELLWPKKKGKLIEKKYKKEHRFLKDVVNLFYFKFHMNLIRHVNRFARQSVDFCRNMLLLVRLLIYHNIKGRTFSPWLFCSHSFFWNTSSPGWGELPGWPPAELCLLPCDTQHSSLKVTITEQYSWINHKFNMHDHISTLFQIMLELIKIQVSAKTDSDHTINIVTEKSNSLWFHVLVFITIWHYIDS